MHFFCFRHNLHPPDFPPTQFGHSSLPPRANPGDVQRFPSSPPVDDADIQGMLSKLRQSSSKQPLLGQAPPRLPQPGGAGDVSVVQFRQHVPQRGPSPSQERMLRPRSSLEHDRSRHGFNDETGGRRSDRYQPLESKERQSFSTSGSEMGKARDDESDRQRQTSNLHQNVGFPPPLRFRPDLPRPPPMPQPRGTRPPSLLALSIDRPPSLNHQQPNPPQKELSEPPSLSHTDQNHPSFDDEVQNQRLPTQLNQGNHRPSLQRSHNIERPPLPPEGQRTMSMQEFQRPPRPPRPPGLPEGFRHPQLPSARQPLVPENLRPPHFSEGKRPPSLPLQNFQRPPSFFNDSVLRPSSLPENQLPSQGRMLPVPISRPDSEMQKYHGLQKPPSLQHQTSGETEQNIAAVRESNNAPQEEMHRLPETRKPGPPSVVRKMEDDESDHHRQMSGPYQNAGASPQLRFRPDLPRPPPIPPLRGPPSLMDLNLRCPPFPPPSRPALPAPAVCGIPDSAAAPMIESNSQQPFSAQQGKPRGSTSQSISDPHSSTANYQVGMSDEALQFTSRMPPHSADNSFQRNQSPRVSKSGVHPPFSSSTVPLPGASSYPVGMSDEPLQFTGRMPAPRMQDPSLMQRMPSFNVRPLTALQPSEDVHPTHGAGNYPVGMSDEPLQFSGRMPAPRMQDPSVMQRLPGSNVRPLTGPQSSEDIRQMHGAGNYLVGMSDEPLQFSGRMPAPRMQDPSVMQRLPGSNVHPLSAPQSSEDIRQMQGAGSYPVGMSDDPLQFSSIMPAPRMQDPSVMQRLPGSNVRPLTGPQSSEDVHRMQGAGNYPVGMSDKPLQFTGRMAAPHIQDSSDPRPHLALGSNIRPGFSSGSVSLQTVGHKNQLQGPGNYPVGMSDEPLQFTGRMPVPRIPDSSSHRQPHHLPDSGIRPSSVSQTSISTAVSAPVQTLQLPVRPPLGMPLPPFIGIPPPRPMAPPQVGTGPHLGIPLPDNVTGPSTRLPPPFPGGTALRPPVDGSVALPGSEMSHALRAPVAGAVLPRPPFFSPMPNVVS